MQVLAESTWSWLLLADGERRLLSVLCGTVGLYELTLELTTEECPSGPVDWSSIDRLARSISYSPKAFLPRHQPTLLDSDEAREAIACWRKQQDSIG